MLKIETGEVTLFIFYTWQFNHFIFYKNLIYRNGFTLSNISFEYNINLTLVYFNVFIMLLTVRTGNVIIRPIL